MNMFIPLRRVALLFSSLVVLALSACATPPPPTSQGHPTHKIMIHYDANATPQWSYTFADGKDAKNARVKRKDTILWQCDDGAWTVYFKGPSPFGDLGYVSGAAGASAGGEVTEKVKPGDVFPYGVSVLLPGTQNPVIDDPRIIIEN
jgi:hypothetical protein